MQLGKEQPNSQQREPYDSKKICMIEGTSLISSEHSQSVQYVSGDDNLLNDIDD